MHLFVKSLLVVGLLVTGSYGTYKLADSIGINWSSEKTKEDQTPDPMKLSEVGVDSSITQDTSLRDSSKGSEANNDAQQEIVAREEKGNVSGTNSESLEAGQKGVESITKEEIRNDTSTVVTEVQVLSTGISDPRQDPKGTQELITDQKSTTNKGTELEVNTKNQDPNELQSPKEDDGSSIKSVPNSGVADNTSK